MHIGCLSRVALRMLVMMLVLFPPGGAVAESAPLSREAEGHFAAGERHISGGRHFLAAKEYRQALALGRDGTDVRWKLSLALYGLGLVDEAIVEIGKAQALSPEANFLHLPGGILYLARGDLDQAAQHFHAALQINPGFADAYYYLGEVYYRQGNYQRAWLCCLAAKTLGHPGDGLKSKLEAVSVAPAVSPWRAEREVLHLRLIQVVSREEARQLLERMAAGELFEQIAAERSRGNSQGFGGYTGVVAPADLDPAVAAVLLDLDAFDPPLVLEVAGGYRLIQRIAPFDPGHWDQLLTTAAQQPGSTTPGPARPASPLPTAAASSNKPTKVPAVPNPAAVAGAISGNRRAAVDAADADAARTAPPARPPANAAVLPRPYRLHAGSHVTEDAARKQVQTLQELGFPSFQFKLETAGGSYHVIAGKYAAREEAEAGAARLKQLGITHYISRQL